MDEILELLQRVDLLLREKIAEKDYGVGSYARRQTLADARELLQRAINKILLVCD